MGRNEIESEICLKLSTILLTQLFNFRANTICHFHRTKSLQYDDFYRPVLKPRKLIFFRNLTKIDTRKISSETLSEGFLREQTKIQFRLDITRVIGKIPVFHTFDQRILHFKVCHSRFKAIDGSSIFLSLITGPFSTLETVKYYFC